MKKDVNAIAEYSLSNGRKLIIKYDEDSEDPREWDNLGKLCLRKHRRYNFPNELEFDFDDGYEEDTVEKRLKELEKTYFIFRLDCYEHG